MKKILLASVVLVIFATSIALFQLTSCVKSTAQTNSTVNCDVRGRYTGVSHSALGSSGIFSYTLKDNNFAVGTVLPTDPAVTFGGYRNTCDSVVMSVYYTSNNSYYLMQGRLSHNDSTISGIYYNLRTTADSGTFVIEKY